MQILRSRRMFFKEIPQERDVQQFVFVGRPFMVPESEGQERVRVRRRPNGNSAFARPVVFFAVFDVGPEHFEFSLYFGLELPS